MLTIIVLYENVSVFETNYSSSLRRHFVLTSSTLRRHFVVTSLSLRRHFAICVKYYKNTYEHDGDDDDDDDDDHDHDEIRANRSCSKRQGILGSYVA